MEENYRIVDAAKLKKLVAAIMEGEGAPADEAAVIADSLVEADLTNVQSHGVTRVRMYTDSIDRGGTSPVCRMETLSDYPACAVLDAHGAVGIVAAYKAMGLAMDKARAVGVGMVSVRNSNHCSAAGYFVKMAAREDMLAFACSNAPKSMAPWGSRVKYLGTNPFAVGAPTQGDPFVLDMATSVVARGKIILASKKGAPIPEGWAIDPEGNPTTDAEKALEGCVLPFGGPKGSGISMMIDVLSGVLSGAAYGSHLPNPFAHPELGMDTGHCFIAIDIAKFMDPARFKAEMENYRREVKGLDRAKGVEEIFVPGEIEFRNRARNLREGIRLPGAVCAELQGLAARHGIPFDIEREAV